jgi:hypothetical protein
MSQRSVALRAIGGFTGIYWWTAPARFHRRPPLSCSGWQTRTSPHRLPLGRRSSPDRGHIYAKPGVD